MLTEYTTGMETTAKIMGRRLMRETLRQTYMQRFTGTGTDSLVQTQTELTKERGDKITFALRMQLTGAGTSGDGALEGNEESLLTYADTIIVDQLRHAVRSSGRMSEQRVAWSLRDEARMGLSDWWSNRLDVALFNQLCGNTAETDLRMTGFQPTVAPSSANQLIAGAQAAETSLSTTNVFTLTLIDQAVERAKTMTPQLRPVRQDAGPYYVMFLHPFQVTSLRANTNAGQWLDIQKAALTGGQLEKNPIFTGALGLYNGVVLQESTRVTTGANGTVALPNVRRAVLCGAQAAAVAYSHADDAWQWTEESFDYGNQLGVSGGCIFGLKKVRFNNRDYGTVVVSSYAASS